MMKISINSFLCIIICLCIFTQCNDDADKYYEKPEWLEEPVYSVLEQEGRFGLYLQCVDRTSYAGVLKGGGLYTVFAPNDAAFSAWMNEKSYASVAAIPLNEVTQIVAYSIVYSKWTLPHLGDYFEAGIYVPGAFKRKTNQYALPYKDPEFDNNWVIDQTSNNGLNTGMNNSKYLPVYTSSYFNTFPVPLTAYDYNVFYPNSEFTGKNVQEGTILTEDIRASNGIIHEVSTVNEPLDNIDRILKGERYDVFKSLLDHKNITGEYAFKVYSEVPDLLDKYRKIMPDTVINSLYVKYYQTVAFSPLLENVVSSATGVSDPEKTGYTLFIPQNDALTEFINAKLLKYYNSLDDLPLEVISTLINTHMVTDLVWPSLYESAMNATGEFVNGEGNRGKKFDEAGISGIKVASNGFVFQTDEVIKSGFFETVYSEIFLNPAHTLLNQAYVNFYSTGLRLDLMKSILNGYSSERNTMLNFSDALLQEDGFAYDLLSNSFPNPEMSTGADDRLKRLMRMHIFPGLKNDEINSEVTDFSQGIVSNYNNWGFTVNYYGDAVRYKNYQLQAAGNIEDNTYVTLTKEADYINGTVYNVDRMLQYSPRETAAGDDRWKDLTLWKYLDRARKENPNVSQFVAYIERCLKNADTEDLDGIKPENYYTVLMPNNSAMQQAITRGYIKALADVTSDDAGKEDLAQATKFVNAHFLQGRVFVDDGLTYLYPVNPMETNKYLIPTLLKITNETLDLTNERTLVEVSKTSGGLLSFIPQDITLGSKVLVDGAFGTTLAMRVQRGAVSGSSLPDNFRSNRIACKAVLHEINNFFVFDEITE